MRVTDGQMCGRGRLQHHWTVVPLEWKPDTYEVYDTCVNERCKRDGCAKLKANLWSRGVKLKPRYKWDTGAFVKCDTDDRPSDADFLAYMLALAGGERSEQRPRKPQKTRQQARAAA